jgi:hypothetical protein
MMGESLCDAVYSFRRDEVWWGFRHQQLHAANNINPMRDCFFLSKSDTQPFAEPYE